MKEITPKMISVYANVEPNCVLFDHRLGKVGIKFGTIEQICHQYGISLEKKSKCLVFSAPKLRLQMLIEKLHFARIKYWF